MSTTGTTGGIPGTTGGTPGGTIGGTTGTTGTTGNTGTAGTTGTTGGPTGTTGRSVIRNVLECFYRTTGIRRCFFTTSRFGHCEARFRPLGGRRRREREGLAGSIRRKSSARNKKSLR